MQITRPDGPEAASYAGALVSVLSSMTLTEWGVIIGIVTALATFILNWWVKTREEMRAEQAAKRSEEEHEARMKLLARGINV